MSGRADEHLGGRFVLHLAGGYDWRIQASKAVTLNETCNTCK